METVINIYMLLLCTYGSGKKTKKKQHKKHSETSLNSTSSGKKNLTEIGGE